MNIKCMRASGATERARRSYTSASCAAAASRSSISSLLVFVLRSFFVYEYLSVHTQTTARFAGDTTVYNTIYNIHIKETHSTSISL
jgi:hypothetical protein